MTNSMGKELKLIRMEKLKKEFGKMVTFSMFKNLKIHKFMYLINHA